jgi:hypothetical protein
MPPDELTPTLIARAPISVEAGLIALGLGALIFIYIALRLLLEYRRRAKK